MSLPRLIFKETDFFYLLQVFSQVSVGETSQNTVWRAEAGADAYVYITGDVDENLDTLNRDEDITDQFMDEKDIKVPLYLFGFL